MIKYVKLADLPADPDLQIRERVNEGALKEYADLYQGGPEAMEPPRAYRDEQGEVWVWDGYTRICAAKLAGLAELPIDLEDGGREQALVRALTEANRRHGVRLEGQDLRRKARLALKVPELRALSNVQLAERIGVNREYIRVERHEMEDTGEIAATAVSSADGKQIPTRKTKAKAEPAMPEPSPDLVGLLKGLPDDLELDVDTATELPMEQRCQRVSVWRFTIGYRVMSAASLAQLEQLAQAEDQAMRTRAAAPPARLEALYDDQEEDEEADEEPAAQVELPSTPTPRDPVREPRPYDVFAWRRPDAPRPYALVVVTDGENEQGFVRILKLGEGGRRDGFGTRLFASEVRYGEVVQAAIQTPQGGWVPPKKGYDYTLPPGLRGPVWPRPPAALLPSGHEDAEETPTEDAAPLPPAAERRAEGRERGARVSWVITRLHLLREWGCPEVADAPPADHVRAVPQLDDEALAELAETLSVGRVLVAAHKDPSARSTSAWSILDLGTMECVIAVDGTPLVWEDRELAEAVLEGGAVEAWTAPREDEQLAEDESMATPEATPETRERLHQALTRAIDRGVKEIEGLGALLMTRAHLIGDQFVLLAGPAARALELLAAHEEADAAGAWWLTTSDVERLRDEVQGYSDQLAAWFTQPHHERSLAEWAAADAAVDTWMGTDCDELPVMEPRTFLAALMHRAVRPDRVVYGIDYGLQRHDPARDAIAHQDVRPTPGRTGEIWLPIDASAEAIAEAIADIQSRCKKHLALPARLAARVRTDLDRVLHTAALWSLPVAALRPTGQWGELPPEGSSGARPDTTVVELCGQSYLATPPEGVAAPALLIFRGGISSSRLEGVVEFRSPRAADPLPT